MLARSKRNSVDEGTWSSDGGPAGLAGATLAAAAASVWKKLALQRKRQSPEGETTSIAVLNIIFDLLPAVATVASISVAARMKWSSVPIEPLDAHARHSCECGTQVGAPHGAQAVPYRRLDRGRWRITSMRDAAIAHCRYGVGVGIYLCAAGTSAQPLQAGKLENSTPLDMCTLAELLHYGHGIVEHEPVHALEQSKQQNEFPPQGLAVVISYLTLRFYTALRILRAGTTKQ